MDRLIARPLVLMVLLVAAASAQTVQTSPSAVLSSPDRFDGQTVIISGTITNLQPRVSRAGNAYYTLDLSDGRQVVRVFSFGQAPCRSGQAIVEGVFEKVKQQGRYTFYNEITATKVACR